MRINEVTFDGGRPVDGYGPGFFRIAGEIVEGAVAILPSGVVSWAGPADARPLIAAADEIDVLFLGLGADVSPIPAALAADLDRAGIAVEAMATPAACRTYNVLLSEGRRVALAVLPV
jgi:uncharacterized protein